jgi:putative membrane-bound dehydrogenase-like protein
MRPILFLSLSLLAIDQLAAGKELEGERAAATSVCPSPEEARAKMSVPEGYEVRCFAHEPMVQNPVAMTWDHRGRLWIVEAYEYPEGTPLPMTQRPFGGEARDDQYHPMPKPGVKTPRDRVIILEDTDNDGEADKRTVFVEGLNLASAIICGDDGIYVGQQPHLIHFRDADGDDKPDAWRVVLTGFGREDTHELVNSFTWGPDGWLYMTHGVFTNSKVRRPGQPESEGFKFDAGIGRARATTHTKEGAWEFEVFADGTSNPWGCDYDAAGNFFVSACVIDHFFHMAPGGIYVRQGGAPENPYAYELLPSIVKHKHFRAAYAGIQIYQGGRYPADTNGHAFIGNIHDNAIHEEVLTPVGASFKCEPRRDFLRANNGWFRPVSTQTGPDGFLWIMDWCDKYPCYQNAKANPEGVDRVRGRIWRVVMNDAKSKTTRERTDLDLKKRAISELVATLTHPNNWMRRMARRMLAERMETEEATREIARIPSDIPVPVKLECVYAMHGMGLANGVLLDRLAKNPDASIRYWSARFTGESWRIWAMQTPNLNEDVHHIWDATDNPESFAATFKRLKYLAADKDMPVRHAVAVAARQLSAGLLTVNRPTKLVQEASDRYILERLIEKVALDSWDRNDWRSFVCPFDSNARLPPGDYVKRPTADALIAFAVWQAYEPINGKNGGTLGMEFFSPLKSQQPAYLTMILRSYRRCAETATGDDLDKLILSLPNKDKNQRDCLIAVLKGLENRNIKPSSKVAPALTDWLASDDADVRYQAEKLAVIWGLGDAENVLAQWIGNASYPLEKRIEALRLARKHGQEVLKKYVEMILFDQKGTEPEEMITEALRSISYLSEDIEPADKTAEMWKSFTPTQRFVASEMLASRPRWALSLLDLIQSKRIPRGDIPMTVVRSLVKHTDKKVQKRAVEVLGAWQDSSADVKALIAQKKQACLTGEPDLANGKLIFTATCMVCHEFHGGGQKVGPDLIGSGRSNLDAILANVIDPNQIIGNGYENFTVSTKDGRTLAGRVVEDTPGYVKLLGAGGATQVVPRDQVASITNTKQSLMPMGFGNLPDTAFRDLVWYVLAPPEEGTLTKEKKELLIKGVEVTSATKPKGNSSRAIDWESVSLWNPEWQVSAPDFERTPVKLGEYYGRKNVLLMHPFPDKKTPASLERKFKVEAGKTKLKATVAADDRGDWTFKAVVNGQVVKEMTVDHEKPRWKTAEIDLAKYAGQEVTVRLEAHPSGWSMEFAYWGGIVLE